MSESHQKLYHYEFIDNQKEYINMDICRAITFINFHIPVVLQHSTQIQYATVGFFDGMQTQQLDVRYNSEELMPLWKYILNLTTKSRGQYSYQNIFCFSKDEWNVCTDEYFWSDQTNQEYPLTFVVFLQLRDYQYGDGMIAKQCRSFHSAIHDVPEYDGVYYSYCTIDKNDFVVCLKCRDYKNAVKAIKSLHCTGAEVIYSYSVFSVSSIVLEELNEKTYAYLFHQSIDSICLKGISNSYDPQHEVTLDQKYVNFCNELVHRLYQGKEQETDTVFKIYDILGDNDFRLIAKEVNLGILLQQYASGGMLCYKEKNFQFYFFSTNLVIDILTPDDLGEVSSQYLAYMSQKMQEEFQSPLCDMLEQEMSGITKILYDDPDVSFVINEKKKSFSHAIWQLLQSLKAIERAPTKKYDFWSLYKPLSVMISILEEKLKEKNKGQYDEISQNAEVYEFIHKISMTLHGTLRTDIQFFQIRDFNVIVHYAPAKLRAFYALWALRLSDFYNDFNDYKNQYSFICCPGMFHVTCVKPLFQNYKENSRLMLIAVPERHLYAPKRLSIVLAHEVSHFVGYKVRNRPKRHQIWLKCCVRVLVLEMNHFRYRSIINDDDGIMEEWLQDPRFYEELEEQLAEEDELVQKERENLWPHMFHSRNSIEIIKRAFSSAAEKNYIKKIVSDSCARMTDYFKKRKEIQNMQTEEKVLWLNAIRKAFEDDCSDLLVFYSRFQTTMLPMLLRIFKYITTEAYADLIAILTLNLAPRDYILSFCEGELNVNIKEKEERDGLPLCLRAGMVINAVCHVVQIRQDYFSGTQFSKEWRGSVFQKICQDAPEDSSEQWLSLNIYSYINNLRDCNQNIKKYSAVYNDTVGIMDFTNTDFDCLNDRMVWNLMEMYMNQCAEDYISILCANDQLQVEQKRFVHTYSNIVNGSVTDLSQEIENFLKCYEENGKKYVKKILAESNID